MSVMTRRPRTLWIGGPACLVILLALAGCGDRGTDPDVRGQSDPGPVHVHGLGVNPADGALFIATHTGLFRAASGERTARRVAGRYQDTMGFTVAGPDRFLGSGHPDLREKLPPFLGLIESRDAGESWQARSLRGRADFHVLEASGQRVYGYGSDWETRRPQFLTKRRRRSPLGPAQRSGAADRTRDLPLRSAPTDGIRGTTRLRIARRRALLEARERSRCRAAGLERSRPVPRRP